MSYEKNYWMIPMDFVKYPFCKKTGEYKVKEGQAKRLKSTTDRKSVV